MKSPSVLSRPHVLYSGAWPSSCWHLLAHLHSGRPDSNEPPGKDALYGHSGVDHFGQIVGLVARFLMPGRDPAGFVVTAVLGIVGALLGGFLDRSVGWYREGEPAGFVMAAVGAVVLLVLYRRSCPAYPPGTSALAAHVASCVICRLLGQN
jgi:uncharacterized membrane protein YeaQ/YmgE (transglycosylase-associated protein family)